MNSTDSSNQLFELAAAFVNQTGRHVFLTGKAGTGKTTFLKFIRDDSYKKIAVAAPTGVAAINAGGVTLHSLLQIPLQQFVPVYSTGWNSGLLNKNTLLKQLRISSEKQNLLRELELLIIDEASMVRADLLDAADTILRHVRQRYNEPFGGLQILYIGDLYQLPPVVKDGEWNLLKEHYESPFFFHAQVMRETPLVYIELDKVYRQQDEQFVEVLNAIRTNTVTEAQLEILHKRYQPHFEAAENDHYITLTTHNFKAGQINQEKLKGLNTLLHRFEADVEGDFGEHLYPAEKTLELRKGAQVMFIKNDTQEPRRYYNGKIGVIESIENGDILISFAGERLPVKATRETWENIQYHYNKEKDSVEEERKGAFLQYPLRLAWAITIHKSQGLTFTKAIVDAGAAFAAGQVYVALSRLTGLEGLVLQTRISAGAIFTDARIKDVGSHEKPLAALHELLQTESRAFAAELLLRVFDWQKMAQTFHEFAQGSGQRQLPEKEKAAAWAQQCLQEVRQQQQTSEKFLPQLETLLQQAQQNNQYGPLNDRIEKAAAYYQPQLDSLLKELYQHLNEYRVKSKTKKYIRQLFELRGAILQKQKQLHQALVLTQSLSKGILPNYTAFKSLPSELAPPPEMIVAETAANAKKPPKGETKHISLALFKEGKTIMQIALFRSLTPGTIEGHLTTFIATGEVSIADLVTPEKQTQIEAAIKELGEVSSTLIKEKLGADISYGEIRAVQAYVKWKAVQAGDA
jgi:hypothetical protein